MSAGGVTAAAPGTPVPGRPVLLLVDDEPAITGSPGPFLEGIGFEVFVAGDGKRALALAAQRRPDVCVLDALMPGADGREVLRRLQAQGSAAIGLVLSRQRAAAAPPSSPRAWPGWGSVSVQHGYGEADPIAPNEYVDGTPDRAGQAKNRRVEIIFIPGTTGAP